MQCMLTCALWMAPYLLYPMVKDITSSVEDLLKVSDFVSLHCPLTASTKHLINAATLKIMKPTAYLINTARGAIVDEYVPS